MSKKYIVYLIEIPNDPKPYVGTTSEKSAKRRVRKGYPNNPPLQKLLMTQAELTKSKSQNWKRSYPKLKPAQKNRITVTYTTLLCQMDIISNPAVCMGITLRNPQKTKLVLQKVIQ